MDQNRGRSPSQGATHPKSISSSPSPARQMPNAGGINSNVQQALSSGKFNTGGQFVGNTYLNSQHALNDYNYFQPTQFQQPSLQDPQLIGQTIDPTFSSNNFMFPNNQIDTSFDPSFAMNSYGMPQPMNVNPADLNKVGSPGHQSPNLLSAETNPSPGSPHSVNEQFFTPQHSRPTSLDPSSVYEQNFWQGANFSQHQHRRAPSDHSDISSAQHSPFLDQAELHFEKVDRSPFLAPQQDLTNTFGIDQFTLANEQPSYRSPRLLPTMDDPQHGLGLGGDMMNPGLTVTGADLYNNQQIDPSFVAGNHNRHSSNVSDIGQADHFPPPTINIEPAPVSRQQSFGPAGEHLDGGLSPPSNSRGRVRSKSDATFSRPMSRSASSGPGRPGLNPNNSDSLTVRAHSHNRSTSRESSPGVESGRIDKGNRRASTSSINSNSRDYVLSHVDPSRQNPSQPGSSTRVQKHPATFQCTLCPKRFTRAYNLRSHLRTHTDERPFVCTVCGKAFARQHDRKRHESLHSGEKKFVCKGELRSQPGQFWGCGRRFARADALGRHFRSEAGGTCIKPLLDEEAAERRNKAMLEHQQQVSQAQQAQFVQGGLQPVPQPMMIPMNNTSSGFTLPAALLAQYPALQNIDWSQISNVEDPGDLSDVGMGPGGFEGSGAGGGGEFFDDDGSEGYVSGSNMGYPLDVSGQGQQHLYLG